MEDILEIGTPAPDFHLIANTGQEIRLSEYKGSAHIVLFFVREYNWIQCRTHVAQLGRIYKEFQTANTEVLVILGETIERAKQYAQTLKTPFPVLADPDREVYRRYGLEKALFVIQRTSSVVIDRKGIVRYMKSATNPMLWLQESKELLFTVNDLGTKAELH